MDTELKKYKRDIFKRVIAVFICLFCISGMASQLLTSYDKAQAQGLVYVNFTDAMRYNVLGIEKNEWEYTTFRNGYSQLLFLLNQKMNSYGNGTEKEYKNRMKEYEANLDKETEAYKSAMIYLASRSFSDFYSLYNSGVIELTGMYILKETGESTDYEKDELSEDLCYSDYRYIDEVAKEPVLPVSVSEEFEGIDYDNVYYAEETKLIYDCDEVAQRYYPGYYAFKVNKDALKKELVSSDAVTGFYSSYNEFYEEYLQNEKEIKKHAGTVRYFIRDKEGNVITNIDNLKAKSTSEEIKKVFSAYGTYSYSHNEEIYLSNGRYYSDTYVSWFQNSEYYEDDRVVIHTTTTMPEVTTVVVPTSVAETKIYVDEKGQAVTMPETTRVSIITNEAERITDGKFELYIGFDKTADYESCHFASVLSNIEKAKDHILDCAYTCGILGAVLFICLIYLIAITGKRKESREIHLYHTDKIFIEIRTAINCGLGFLCFCGIVYFAEIYMESTMKNAVGLCVVMLICIFFLICLDLILYYTRHIKNRSLLRSISIIWLIEKLWKQIKKWKTVLSEKLLYTKNLKTTVLIRTAIVIGINIIVGGAAILFAAAEIWAMGLILVAVLFLFDLYIVYRGLRFVGGANKLFALIKEMHRGNLDIDVNKNSLPDYLSVPAEDLQCLSEGMKSAVNEAVRQEKTKTELITNVSHDLKTPLTSIINYVDLLKKCEITDETAVSYLQVLSEKSDRLKVLIEDLVEASKASAGAISVNFVCVSLKELINQILGEFEDSFEEKKLKVILDMPEEDVKVKADSKHIYRVLENLFVNIRKYALENTRVYITVARRSGKGTINLKNISAASLNISADELKERFVRGEQSRTTEGNGLGLSIAENLCTLQNGTLNIEINGDLFSVTVEMEEY